MTERQKEALNILLEGPIAARDFGLKFWPNHNMHKRVSNNSYGSQAGKAGWLCAGSYLGRLRAKKWVYEYNGRYYITQLAKRLLKQETEVSK